MRNTATEYTRVFLFFTLSALVFLWPLSLQLLTFKNDALTYYYPVRTLISDAINHGELPLWTPYINMGYPLHADLQSGAWNPVVWIIGLTTGYPLAAMHYECVFYFSLAGMGMYMLARNLGAGIWMALIVGMTFQFSGFMLDSIQFFTCISSACWIPFIFLYFRRTLFENNWKNPALFSVFMGMLLLCGYPAFVIITFYLLLSYFLCFLWNKRKQKLQSKRIFIRLGVSIFIFLLLTAPAIISFYQNLPYINRGGAQSLEVVQQNSMNPVTILSMLFPFSSEAPDAFLHSELLMRTVYMGILPLCLLILIGQKAINRDKKKAIAIAAVALLMLLLAFGKYFFLRKLTYLLLPGMDMFRHPGLFRLFFIFFCLLAVTRAFPYGLTKFDILKKWAFSIFIIAAALFCISLVLRLSGNVWIAPINKTFFNTAGFWQRIFIESLFVAAISAFIFWAARYRSMKILFGVLVFDLFVSTQLHLAVTGVGAKSYEQVVKDLSRNPKPFPKPGNTSIEKNSEAGTDSLFEAGSRMPFRKLVGRNDYFITPGNLLMQEQFYASPIRDSIFKKPLISFMQQNIPVTVTKFGANHIEGIAVSGMGDSLLLLQNHYPNWKAFIDGKETAITTSAISFMAVPVLNGKHHFRFVYDPGYLQWAIWLPIAGLIFIVLIFGFSRGQTGKPQTET